MLGPNITGLTGAKNATVDVFTDVFESNMINEGALRSTNNGSAVTSIANGGNANKYCNTIIFNASNANSIYTDVGKVQSLSLALNFIIKS